MIFLGTLEGFNLYKDALLLGKKEGKNKNKRMQEYGKQETTYS